MSANILDGKAIAERYYNDLTKTVISHIQLGRRPPGLAVILVGHHAPSEIYVRNKRKACERVGFQSRAIDLPETIDAKELLDLIESLNKDDSIDGILVQLPLPKHIDQNDILETIHPNKDVDGFHPYNLGRLLQKRPFLRPCTPWGVMKLLAHTEVNLQGLHAVVVGVSNIVGRPMIMELLLAGCTVTACHHLTKGLNDLTLQSDILISATGQPHLIKEDWVKEGATVIDVGIHRNEKGSLIGDVDFEPIKKKAHWITPVPGGVGPMTIASLLENTMNAYTHAILLKKEALDV